MRVVGVSLTESPQQGTAPNSSAPTSQDPERTWPSMSVVKTAPRGVPASRATLADRMWRSPPAAFTKLMLPRATLIWQPPAGHWQLAPGQLVVAVASLVMFRPLEACGTGMLTCVPTPVWTMLLVKRMWLLESARERMPQGTPIPQL